MHRLRCTVEALLTHLPTLKPHKQRPDDGTYGVLEIRNQLDWQQGKGPPPPSAYKTRNGNPLLLELGHQFDGVAPVRGDLSITIKGTTDGTSGTNMGEKIDLTGKKRFCVFPNGFECVKVGELNCSAALLTRGRVFGWLKPFGLPPCRAWLFFRGQFLTSLFPLPLYHRLLYPVNTPHHTIAKRDK